MGKYLWPELEANASYFHGGPNDGKSQVFLTPGLIVSKIKLRKDPKDRLGLVLGTGMQIATSNFHSYNHGVGLTGRDCFLSGLIESCRPAGFSSHESLLGSWTVESIIKRWPPARYEVLTHCLTGTASTGEKGHHP